MQLDRSLLHARSHATSNARTKQAVQDNMHEKKKIASQRGPEAVVRLHDTHHDEVRRENVTINFEKPPETKKKKKRRNRSGPCPRRDPPYNRGRTVSTDKALAQHFTNNSHPYTQTTGACNDDICVGQLTRYSRRPFLSSRERLDCATTFFYIIVCIFARTSRFTCIYMNIYVYNITKKNKIWETLLFWP